jgi:predicted alpha/beta-hydrolase family hydrolase
VTLSRLEVPGDPAVRGVLHPAEGPDGLVLTHGAAGNMDTPLLVAVAEAFAARGVSVLRCNLPYRQARPGGPPSAAGAARDRAGLRAALDALRAHAGGRLFLGGHSYGGRMASMLVAEQAKLVGGLLLQSYPLHPPGKPRDLRTAHLAAIRVPTLFVHGATDPFATTAELAAARALITVRTATLEVNGGHDLGWTPRRADKTLPDKIATAFLDLIAT